MKLKKLPISSGKAKSTGASKVSHLFGNANACIGDAHELVTIKSFVTAKSNFKNSPPSKATNLLLSIKTTTKMKRGPAATKKNAHLQQGMALFASENFVTSGRCACCKKTMCGCRFKREVLCEEEKEEGSTLSSLGEGDDDNIHLNSPSPVIKLTNLEPEKPKKNTLKSFGVSIANIFKPNKRIGRSTQNIIIDNDGIFIPKFGKNNIQVTIEKHQHQNQPPPTLVSQPEGIYNRLNLHTAVPEVTPVFFKPPVNPPPARPVSFLAKINQIEEANKLAEQQKNMAIASAAAANRRAQPSMGLKAHSLKAKKPMDGACEHNGLHAVNNDGKREMVYKTQSMRNGLMHNYMNSVENLVEWNKLPPRFDLDETVVYAEGKELNAYGHLHDNDDDTKEEVYFDVEDEKADFLDSMVRSSNMQDRRCSMASTASKLVPFLDCVEMTPVVSGQHLPMLSSTSVSPSHIGEQLLPVRRELSPIVKKEGNHPVRAKISLPKGKKMKSLSDIKFVPT